MKCVSKIPIFLCGFVLLFKIPEECQSNRWEWVKSVYSNPGNESGRSRSHLIIMLHISGKLNFVYNVNNRGIVIVPVYLKNQLQH